MKKMNKLHILVASCVLGGAPLPAADLLREADLVGNVFASITVKHTNIVLKFKTEGRRFKYSINGGSLLISEYGKEITVPIGAQLKLSDRATSLVFSALPDEIRNNGFQVKLTEDHRSGGGKRKEAEGYLIVVDTKVDDVKAAVKKSVVITYPSIDAAKSALKVGTTSNK